MKNSAFSKQKCPIYFPLPQSKSGPNPNFLKALQLGSNPNSTKYAIIRIQSNPSPVQCSRRRARNASGQNKVTLFCIGEKGLL